MTDAAATEYPLDDPHFEDTTLTKVDGNRDDGWHVTRDDGWSFFVPKDSPVKPRVGMTARLYGKGIGYRFRGMFLDGRKVFYRTEDEDAEDAEIELYGADWADWLARWDAGQGVWSIEMGGLGPGYEQCIQITAAEILRCLLDMKPNPDEWRETDAWDRDRKAIEGIVFANETVSALGLSGAQFGAALSLATGLYRQGPRVVFTDPKLESRKIQVRRDFPQGATP